MKVDSLKPLGLSIVSLLVVVSCAQDLSDQLTEDGGTTESSNITNTDNGDGTTTTQVNASEDATWVYLDLESQAEVTPGDPANSSEWDLGFQRFKIKINGGVSGSGGMEVAVLADAAFDALTEAPATGYLTDQPDSDDEDEDPDYAFLSGDGWYSYNPSDHTLSARDAIYAVRSVDGTYYGLQMLEYYDDAGTSGFPTFLWGSINAPATPAGLTVDASVAGTWTYVSIASGSVVAISDPSTSTDWDIAFSRTQVQTNSGTSGAGIGGARIVPEGSDYASTSASPTVGFAADTMLPVPGPPGSGEFSGNTILNEWFNYDSSTHTVSPKAEVYLVRTADGEYGKLQILAYQDGTYTIQLAPVSRDVTVNTSVIDASDGTAWVYLSFPLDELVTVADSSTDASWDLGLSRTKLQSNSGTSGIGTGGAIDPAAVNLADVSAAPTAGYAVDEMLPLPGPPGSGEYSGNPVLAAWFDYDPATHVTTPKDMAFVLRSADEGFVKLKITDYADGVLTIDWAYAGAGRTDF